MANLYLFSRAKGLVGPLCLSLCIVGCLSDDDDDEFVPVLLVASFDWQMAERTVGIENLDFKPELANGERHWMIQGPGGVPGLFSGVSSVPLDQINPADGFELTLDGCGSIGAEQYIWSVDGSEMARTDECSYNTRLPLGDYEVTLRVEGSGLSDALTENVSVRDILLVIMGDSYTSGEGNGTQYQEGVADSSLAEAMGNSGAGWSEGAYWDYANCHRSTRSGQANAAIDLERADPYTSVTTLFLACSGAQIDNGILGIKDGKLGGAEKPQTYQAYELAIMNGRDIDAVVMGIGGNDVGFVPIVAEGALQPDAFLSTKFELPIPSPLAPLLPFVGDKVRTAEVPDLLLAPDAAYVDPDVSTVPGPPQRLLDPDLAANPLHACDSQYQKATMGEGNLGPALACRESIGTSEFGLADVDRCLTGKGANDCVFARSYYDFANSVWKYPDGSAVGVPDTWPGLAVDEDRVFYTEYPDLTTKFADYPVDQSLQFCQIGLTKDQFMVLLRVLRLVSDNPQLIQALIGIVDATVPDSAVFGLAENEFRWASEAILNAPLNPNLKMVILGLDTDWRVDTLELGFETIGAGDFVNLGNDAPALNEMTALSESAFGWSAVIGTHDLASGHGLCVDQPTGDPIVDMNAAYAYLIATLDGSNASGSAHPNMLGKGTYREPLAEALKQAFLK